MPVDDVSTLAGGESFIWAKATPKTALAGKKWMRMIYESGNDNRTVSMDLETTGLDPTMDACFDGFGLCLSGQHMLTFLNRRRCN